MCGRRRAAVSLVSFFFSSSLCVFVICHLSNCGEEIQGKIFDIPTRINRIKKKKKCNNVQKWLAIADASTVLQYIPSTLVKNADLVVIERQQKLVIETPLVRKCFPVLLTSFNLTEINILKQLQVQKRWRNNSNTLKKRGMQNYYLTAILSFTIYVWIYGK